jgi:hypothetical protein
MKTQGLFKKSVCILLVFFALLILSGFAEVKKDHSKNIESGKCKTVSKEYEMQYGKITLPATGKIVEESHYLTTSDPNKVKCNDCLIEDHLANSCFELKKIGLCSDIYSFYKSKWQKEWTPAEGGGEIGIGATTKWRPTVTDEMWQGNLYFKKLPPLGTKFIFTNVKNSKSVIVHMGYELGPNKKHGIAGLTTEAFRYLQLDQNSLVTIGYIENQEIGLGPINCE